MSISEPSSLLTDYVLGAVALAFAVRLAAAPARGDRTARSWWAAAFALGTLAALAGGTVHGFVAWLPPGWRAALWATTLMSTALAGTLLLAGAARYALRGIPRSLTLTAAAAALAVELGLLWCEPHTRHVVSAGALKIGWLLALLAWKARGSRGALAPVVLGLATAATALAVQRAGLSLNAHFNHNDLAHVLLTAALWPFYRAALCLDARS